MMSKGAFKERRGCVNQIFTLKQIGEKVQEKKCRKYVGFIGLEKAYYVVNRAALWQMLRMYDVGVKLLSRIKNMYVDSSACVRVKGGESERFRINNGVRQGCIIPLLLFKVYMDGVMKYLKMGMGRQGVRFLENGRDWRLSGLFYADDLVLCGESEEDLRAMAGWFAEVCRRRGLKVNVGKSKMLVLNGEEGLECEVHVDGIHLEHVSKFKYLGYVLDESGTEGTECSRKMASRRRVAGATREL